MASPAKAAKKAVATTAAPSTATTTASLAPSTLPIGITTAQVALIEATLSPPVSTTTETKAAPSTAAAAATAAAALLLPHVAFEQNTAITTATAPSERIFILAYLSRHAAKLPARSVAATILRALLVTRVQPKAAATTATTEVTTTGETKAAAAPPMKKTAAEAKEDEKDDEEKDGEEEAEERGNLKHVHELSSEQLAIVRAYVLAGLLDASLEQDESLRRPHLPYLDVIHILSLDRRDTWPQAESFLTELLGSDVATCNIVGCNALTKWIAGGDTSVKRDIAPVLHQIVERLAALMAGTTSTTGAMTSGGSQFVGKLAAATALVACWCYGEHADGVRDALTPLLPTILILQRSATDTLVASGKTAGGGGGAAWVARLTRAIDEMVGIEFMDAVPQEWFDPIWKAQVALVTLPTAPAEIRCAAMDVIVTIAEGIPKVVRKTPAMGHAAMSCCIGLLSMYQQTDEQWLAAAAPITGMLEKKKNGDEEADDDVETAIPSGGGGVRATADGRDDHEPLSNFGASKLDSLCTALGAGYAAACIPSFVALMQEDKWQHRAAGLQAFTQITAHVELKQVPVTTFIAMTKDPHPRVRYNAIRALGQLCNDHHPAYQQKHHKTVLPALINALDDSVTRVQSFAATGIFHFVSDVKDEDEEEKEADGDEQEEQEEEDEERPKPMIPLAPYYDTMVNKLGALLQSAPNHVKVAMLTALTSCGGAAPTRFLKYYDTLMPMMKAVIAHATTPDLIMLRSRAIESVTYIGMMCPLQFKHDAAEVMGLLLDILRSGHTNPGDDNHRYVLHAVTRICHVVKKEFAPVLPLVMPNILASLEREPDWDAINMAHVTKDAETKKLQGDIMTAKCGALDVITSFLPDLGDAYAPYFEHTARLIIPLLSYLLDNELRDGAFGCVDALIKGGVDAVRSGKLEKKVVVGVYASLVQALLLQMTPHDDTKMDLGHPKYHALAAQLLGTGIIDVVTDISMYDNKPGTDSVGVELTHAVLTDVIIADMAHRIANMFTDRVRRTDAYILHQANGSNNDGGGGNGDSDDDDSGFAGIGDDAFNHAQDEEYLSSLFMLVHSAAKALGHRWLPAWLVLRDTIVTAMTSYGNDDTKHGELKRTALDIYVDALNRLPTGHEAVISLLPVTVPVLLTSLTSSDGNHRRAAAYGLGMCAQQCGAAMTPYIPAAVGELGALIQRGDLPTPEDDDDADGDNDDAADVTDHAISALGRIALYQHQDTLWVPWLARLPLTSNRDEADACYLMLCDQVEQNNAAVLGAGFANLPKIAGAICDIIHDDDAHEKPLVTTVARTRLMAIIHKLGGLPPQMLTVLTAALKPQQRATLAELLATAAPAAAPAAAAAATE